MGWEWRNRLFVTSISLATAGILTCSVALLSVVMPNGTPAAYVVTAILFGVLAGGALTAFTWVCDKWDSRNQQDDGISSAKGNSKPADAATELALDGHPDPDLPEPARFRDEYSKTARGLDQPGSRTHATTRTRDWRGQ